MSTAGDESNGNGRVTLALLNAKIDAVSEKLDKVLDCLEKHDVRIRDVEGSSRVNTSQISTIKDDVDRLEKKDTFGTIVTGALGALGIAVGGILGSK